MAFNKKEFAASFLNQVSDNMSDMREEAKAFKQKQIEASERNKSLISTRTARASAAVSLGREALEYLPEGARSKGIIRTAMASGMTGVSELRDKLAKAHANAGLSAGEKLSINDVEAIINNKIYDQNGVKGGNPIIPVASVRGNFKINKIKLLNSRWIQADFSDGDNWGELIIEYFFNQDNTIELVPLSSFLYSLK